MTNDDPGYSAEFAERLAELLAAKRALPSAPTALQPQSDHPAPPSLAPAILFGWAGASYSSIKASKLGLPVARYWVAATVSCVVALMLLVVLGAFLVGASVPNTAASGTSVASSTSSVSEMNQQKLKRSWNNKGDHTAECVTSTPGAFAYEFWITAQGQHLGADGDDIPLSDFTQFFQTACAEWSAGQSV